ncbi:MAG: hypothetical protein Q4E33_02275 [Erysipelotrichaceae bacterium]|nr:hypothetical protein [Erysipelotrichaceae bacterium]
MKFIERIKKDKETFDGLKDRKTKLIFLWDYYKIPIVSAILVFFICIFSLIRVLTTKPVLMYAVLVNSDAQILEVDDSVFTDTLEEAGVDVEGKVVDVNDYLTLGMDNKEEDDIETLQVLNALFSITDLDVFVGFKDDFDKFIEADAFYDLSLLIDEDLLKANDTDLYRYPDSSGKEIVGGIILHSDSALHKANYYHNDVIIGIASNAVYLENASAFVSQLIKD